MRIAEASTTSVNHLWTSAESRVAEAGVLEEAAQAMADQLHDVFSDSVVIARVFLTAPFGDLPAANQEFVRNLVEGAGAADSLTATTPVLSLVGTHGREDDWNDRRKSKGHVGIPLISSSFVDAIPMISRLLKEMGVPIEWIDSHDAEVIIETIGRSAGLFFVDNAAEATDARGRKIIAAQDFVSAHNITGVFGLGGAYDGGAMIVIVAFCSDAFPRESAEQFLSLVTLFKSRTGTLVDSGRIFSG